MATDMWSADVCISLRREFVCVPFDVMLCPRDATLFAPNHSCYTASFSLSIVLGDRFIAR